MPTLTDFSRMIGGQIFRQPFLPRGNLAEKTIIVTGANTGVGFEAAKHLAQLNVDHLILACRSIDKGTQALKTIKDETNFAGQIEVWPLDLADFQSVLSFSQRVSGLSRLNGFIANAGLELQDFQLAEGIEMQLCVNVVSTFLCAISILPKLIATSNEYKTLTNLTFQGSAYHIFGPARELNVPEDANVFDILSQPPINLTGRYALSKLILHQCVHELADRVGGVVINTTHPGWAATELSRAKTVKPIGEKLGFALIGWTAEKGSRSCVYAVTASDKTHGRYLSEGRIAPESEFIESTQGRQIQRRVWKDLMSKITDISPEIAQIIQN